jgi:hypothetical protein
MQDRMRIDETAVNLIYSIYGRLLTRWSADDPIVATQGEKGSKNYAMPYR